MPGVRLTSSNLHHFTHLILSLVNMDPGCTDGHPPERDARCHKLLYVREGGLRCLFRDEGNGVTELTARKGDVCFCPRGCRLSLRPRKDSVYHLFEFRYFGVLADYFSQNSLALCGQPVPPQTPFTLEADAEIEDGAAVGLVFGFINAGTWSCASYDIESRLAHIFGEAGSVQKSLSPEQSRLRERHHLKIVFDAHQTLSYFADGDLVGTLDMPGFGGGAVGVNSYISRARFSNILFSMGEQSAPAPLGDIRPFTGIWEIGEDGILARNKHNGTPCADRSYIYNEASFPVSPPIEELDMDLPRLIHTGEYTKIPAYFRDIEQELREHASGYNNAVKGHLNAVILALLRLADPACGAVIRAADAVCLRAAKPDGGHPDPLPAWIACGDIELLSSRPAPPHSPQVIGRFSADDAQKTPPSSAAENGGDVSGPPCFLVDATSAVWINAAKRADLRNFLSTACLRLAVKAERPMTLDLSLWDLQIQSRIRIPLRIAKGGVWQTFLLPLGRHNVRPTSQHYCRLAREYIGLHYGERIHAKDVADSVHITPAHLSRLFREESGRPLGEYLIGYRIEKAKMWLAESELSLQEIAARVGFYDSSHFVHTFVKWEGLLPGEYRKAHR